MRKHAAPRPALFSRPGTYLAAATAACGILVGALPAPPAVAAAVAAPVAAVLAVLAAAPAPGETAPSGRRAARRSVPAAVYTRTVIHLAGTILFGVPKPARRPLESEARSGSRPLESEAAGYRMLAKCWCGCGGGFLVADSAAG